MGPQDSPDPAGKGWLPSLISGGLAVGGSILGFLLNKHETDTAHQREVADLKKAGISPLMTASTRGAASADASQIGSSIERGASTALAVRMAREQIEAVKAGAEQSRAAALLSRTQAFDLQSQASAGKYDLLGFQRDLAELSVSEKRQLIPVLVEKAKAEVKLTLAGADRARVLGALDSASIVGAKNLEKLEKDLGEAGPAGRLLLEVLRTLRKPR